jgi:hypothetical protein
MRPLASIALAALAAFALLGACGLISSDVTDFSLRLPEKPFNVDTADWMLQIEGTVPAVPCPPADCSNQAATFCDSGACSSACDVGAHCDVTVPIHIFNAFDLATEAPELMKLDAQAIISVTVDSVAFRIDSNSFTTASPVMHLFLAPQGVTDSADPSAIEVGTLEPVAPGQTGEVSIMFSDAGKAAMEDYMSAYRTPFTVIVSASVHMAAGDPVPEGALAGAVTVLAHAGL